jgi:hypothetical protein
MKAIEEHLEIVSVENAKKWVIYTDSINVFASANGIKIGVSPMGLWVVKSGELRFEYATAKEAIAKYHELVKG